MSHDLVQRVPGKLGDVLSATLTPDESLLASLHTAQGEGIAVTDLRVIILKAGLYANAGMFGKKAISYNFRVITSVEHREGILGGHVKILVAGVQESGSANFAAGKNSYWGKNRESENVVTYARTALRPVVREMVALMQTRAHDARRSVATSSAAVGLADQLLKLQELRNAGVLSDGEFAAAKQRLISG